MCQRMIYKVSPCFFSSSSFSFVTLTISPLSHTFFSFPHPPPLSPFCLLFFLLPLPSSNFPYPPPSTTLSLSPSILSLFILPPSSHLISSVTSSSLISPPLLPSGQLLDLHRGQGKEIYWRDGHICPDEQEYRDMVRQSECTLFPW